MASDRLDVLARTQPLRLRWNTLAGWHISGVSGLPSHEEQPGPVEYVPESQLRGAVEALERIVAIHEDTGAHPDDDAALDAVAQIADAALTDIRGRFE